MTIDLPDEAIYKLADNSVRSVLYMHTAHAVAMHYHSMHYLSSKLICSCVMLNLLLNSEITPHSADEIITCMRRRTKSLYTTIDSAFTVVEKDFHEYAKQLLDSEYDEIISLDLRKTNFIVYVLSRDIYENFPFDKKSVFYDAFDYEELRKYRLNY